MPGRDVAVWAPNAARVDLVCRGTSSRMRAQADGWHRTRVEAHHGESYAFSLDGRPALPDPRATWLPDGVHSPGRFYDHDRFGWTDHSWAGREWSQAVVYELHVGTFTVDATFDGAAKRLGHLVDLGVTHVELMPVCAFDGDAGWGYDGVGLWSVHEPYGGPDGLKRFVDAAHGRGLAVILDVVHNHLGPSGNYLADFGPYFTDRVSTPWGEAVNLDGPGSDEVHSFLLGSVTAWLRDYHVDGIRLDAVHELHDSRAVTFLEEVSRTVDDLAVALDRPMVTIAESDRNDPRTVTPRSRNGLGMTAQWDDDVHHALHAWLTGESQGYYADFAAQPAQALRDVFTGAFFHAESFSTFRGRTHGRPVDPASVPAWRFVASLQTHDQVGNRAHGDRLSSLVPESHLAAGAALLLLGPFIPMLFMGEEWAATTPWQFFSSFPDPDLAAAVTDGRRAEFAEHGWHSGDVPDPQDRATVHRSRLDWAEVESEPHARMHAWYKALISLRREHTDLHDDSLADVDIAADEQSALMRRGRFWVVASLGAPTAGAAVPGAREVIASFSGGVVLSAPGSSHASALLPGPGAAVLR